GTDHAPGFDQRHDLRPAVAGRVGDHPPRLPRQLGPRELALADAVRHGVLRDRVHGVR
ncbi:MAG: NADH-ubiquinone oxidoreductase chain B, partial [uncultured Thermomicrobiales bacterium]